MPERLDVCYFLGQSEVRGVTKEYDFTRLKGSVTIEMDLLISVLNDQEANKQTSKQTEKKQQQNKTNNKAKTKSNKNKQTNE